MIRQMEMPLPVEADYPEKIFQTDLPPEFRVGCAKAYFKTNVITRGLFRRRVQIVFEFISSRKWEHALDAGTGAGFLLPGLAAQAKQVDGVDLAPVMHYTQGMLEKRGLHNVKLTEADLLHLPFPDRTFDLAVCLSVIEHIPEPGDALKELARVLYDDGAMLALGYPLENAFFLGLEWLIRLEKRARILLKGKPLPRGKAFHPHVTDCRNLERIVETVFEIEERRNIRVLGIPVYRILKLRKRRA